MSSVVPDVPVVSLACTDCEGCWPADWLLDWEFTTCPNCGGELRPPAWIDRPEEPAREVHARRRFRIERRDCA